MRSEATTVEEYLAELPEDRREAIARVRELVLSRLPDGYEETMDFGMVGYVVPLDRCPDTYNGRQLMYAALASQKNHMSLYLMCAYTDEDANAAFRAAYAATGKRLDMGRSCVRFRRVDDLALDVIGDAIASVGVDEFVERCTAAR